MVLIVIGGISGGDGEWQWMVVMVVVMVVMGRIVGGEGGKTINKLHASTGKGVHRV